MKDWAPEGCLGDENLEKKREKEEKREKKRGIDHFVTLVLLLPVQRAPCCPNWSFGHFDFLIVIPGIYLLVHKQICLDHCQICLGYWFFFQSNRKQLMNK